MSRPPASTDGGQDIPVPDESDSDSGGPETSGGGAVGGLIAGAALGSSFGAGGTVGGAVLGAILDGQTERRTTEENKNAEW